MPAERTATDSSIPDWNSFIKPAGISLYQHRLESLNKRISAISSVANVIHFIEVDGETEHGFPNWWNNAFRCGLLSALEVLSIDAGLQVEYLQNGATKITDSKNQNSEILLEELNRAFSAFLARNKTDSKN